MNANNLNFPLCMCVLIAEPFPHYTLFPIRKTGTRKVIDPKTPAHNSDTRLLTFSQDCEKYINFFLMLNLFIKIIINGVLKNIKYKLLSSKVFKDKFPWKITSLYFTPMLC